MKKERRFYIRLFADFGEGLPCYLHLGDDHTKEEAVERAEAYMKFFRPIKDAGNETLRVEICDREKKSPEKFMPPDPICAMHYVEGPELVVLKPWKWQKPWKKQKKNK